MTLSNKEIMELTGKYVASTYSRFPIAIERGQGCRVWDADGNEYLDFVAGLAVTNLGHCHPKVVAAIREQAGKLMHVSNLFHIGPQAELAKLLVESSFADRVFFCNSGAEANEAAMKLARKYFSNRGERRARVITMEKSFHGRTMGAMAATAQVKIQKGYEPLLEEFTYVPFGDLEAVKRALTPETAAVLVEPVQGEGGVNIPPAGYVEGLRGLCDDFGALLIFDEVQVGMGRTGKLFAYEHFGVAPDIMTLAKGLAGGAAIGAMLAEESVAEAFGPGSHASTFGGNPLAASAGLSALRATIDEKIPENAARVGAYLTKKLDALRGKYKFIKDVRGMGLIIGMELDIPGSDIVKRSLEKRLLINCTSEKVLRFIPALVVTEREVDEMLGILVPILDEFKAA